MDCNWFIKTLVVTVDFSFCIPQIMPNHVLREKCVRTTFDLAERKFWVVRYTSLQKQFGMVTVAIASREQYICFHEDYSFNYSSAQTTKRRRSFKRCFRIMIGIQRSLTNNMGFRT